MGELSEKISIAKQELLDLIDNCTEKHGAEAAFSKLCLHLGGYNDDGELFDFSYDIKDDKYDVISTITLENGKISLCGDCEVWRGNVQTEEHYVWQTKTELYAADLEEAPKLLEEMLYIRLNENFADFKKQMLSLSKEEIYKAAYRIYEMDDLHERLQSEAFFADGESKYLLQFQNPFDIFAEYMADCDDHSIDLEQAIKDICGKDMGAGHSLYSETVSYVKQEAEVNHKISLPMTSVQNGEVKPGDWVIAKPNEEYGCLVGMVMDIDRLGTPEHDTENETDDIHVNFMAIEYSREKEAEIFEAFDHKDPNAASFSELPFDDVIMAPDMLIRITELGFGEINRLANNYKDAEAYCYIVLDGDNRQNEMLAELTDRVEKNFTDYKSSLLNFSKQELIDMAGKIQAMSDAHSYMTVYHDYDEHELEYLLEFQNPLEVLANEWRERQIDLSDMCFAMEYVYEHSDSLLEQYPVMSDLDASADIGSLAEKLSEIREPAEELPQPEQKTPKRKQTLDEKLRAAGEKVKAQEINNNTKSHKKSAQCGLEERD